LSLIFVAVFIAVNDLTWVEFTSVCLFRFCEASCPCSRRLRGRTVLTPVPSVCRRTYCLERNTRGAAIAERKRHASGSSPSLDSTRIRIWTRLQTPTQDLDQDPYSDFDHYADLHSDPDPDPDSTPDASAFHSSPDSDSNPVCIHTRTRTRLNVSSGTQ